MRNTATQAGPAQIPEADRLNGFAHPRTMAVCYGHVHAEQELLNAAASDRLHHAWLFTGPPGIGKATLAYRFARFLLSWSNDETRPGPETLDIPPDGRVFGQVAALSHPNLLVLRRPWQEDRKRLAMSIPVSEARRLRRFFGHTAGGGTWRVVIIDRAEELNAAAANALLKNLEEPPARCVFLLICSAPGRLPVTIRSRCRVMRLKPLDESDLLKSVDSAYQAAGLDHPGDDAVRKVVCLAQGSVGRALRMLEAGGNELHERLLGLLKGLPALDHQAAHVLADELSLANSDQAYHLFFDLAGETLSRIVTHATTGEGAIGDESELADRIQATGALAQFAQLWETIQRAKAEADVLNLDRKTTVLGTFFRLEETAREALS